MHDDKALRTKFAGVLLTVLTLVAWEMWRLMMVE